MASSRQPDLFQAQEQSDLLGEDAPTPEYRADPDAVRAELYKILAEARGAEASLGAKDGSALSDDLSADDELAP
jgi:hypothetical protein